MGGFIIFFSSSLISCRIACVSEAKSSGTFRWNLSSEFLTCRYVITHLRINLPWIVFTSTLAAITSNSGSRQRFETKTCRMVRLRCCPPMNWGGRGRDWSLVPSSCQVKEDFYGNPSELNGNSWYDTITDRCKCVGSRTFRPTEQRRPLHILDVAQRWSVSWLEANTRLLSTRLIRSPDLVKNAPHRQKNKQTNKITYLMSRWRWRYSTSAT